MSDQAQPTKGGGWLKAAVVGMLGLGGGAAGTYGTAFIDRVAKPTRPVANFAVATDGLTVTCQNHASGESGWWDFGDGTALEPFDAGQAELKHTYARPGNYTVKLTVRNFVAD
jgi:PKD repeat protein